MGKEEKPPLKVVDKPTGEKLDADAAKKVLEAERRERAARCGARIDEVLKEENCFIDVTKTVNQRTGIAFAFAVVAREK